MAQMHFFNCALILIVPTRKNALHKCLPELVHWDLLPAPVNIQEVRNKESKKNIGENVLIVPTRKNALHKCLPESVHWALLPAPVNIQEVKNKESKKNIGENVLPVIVHERMGTVFEISGKIGHSGTILYRVPNVWEWLTIN